MEKVIPIGSVGNVDFVLADGKASVKVSVGKVFADAGIEVQESLAVIMDEKVLLDKLVAAMPAGLLKDAAAAAEKLALSAQATAAPAAPAASVS